MSYIDKIITVPYYKIKVFVNSNTDRFNADEFGKHTKIVADKFGRGGGVQNKGGWCKHFKISSEIKKIMP